MDYSLNVPYTNTMATDYTTINSQNLTQTPSVKLPTYQPSPVDPNLAPSVLAGIAGQFDSVNMQNERALQEQQANRDQQNNLSSALLGKTADTQAFQDQAGVNAARATQDQYTQQIYDLNAQASSLMKEGEAAKQNAVKEGRQFGSVQSFVTSQQNEIERNRAIKALEISANADIAQASLLGSQMKLQAAKDKAQQMVDLKYKPMEDALAMKKEQYELNKDVLASIDKKRTEALNAAIKKEEAQIAEQKANEKGIADLVTNAAGQGAPEDIRARAAKAKTPMEAANILGVYAGDYLKNQLLKEQIKKAKADTAETYAKIGVLGAKSDGREVVTEGGVPLVKVTPKEIQDLNDTQIAKNSLVSLVDGMITSIDKYGTQVMFGKEAGTRSGAKTNLLLAMKNLEKTGALDKGTIDVLTGTIPDSKFFATEAAQKAALQQLKDTVNGKVDEYIGSYKGTTAETDPRTKRIYETTGVVSSGNAQADAYFKMTSQALTNVNNSMSTPNAVNAGFIDNQK